MLGLEAITGMTPAGTPIPTGVGLLFACDGGLISLPGGEATIRRAAVLSAAGGQITVNGTGAIIGRSRNFRADGGVYEVVGGSARIYLSAFFYGDPEVLRLPAEVTTMRKPAEPRDMVSIRGAVESVTTEDQDDALGPRLRRT